MKKILTKLFSTSFAFLFILAIAISPLTVNAQDEKKASQDNSSAFNDSIKFDDMEPIFYDADDDEEEAVTSSEGEGGGSGMMLYAGIAVVLIVVLILLKKMGKKKS